MDEPYLSVFWGEHDITHGNNLLKTGEQYGFHAFYEEVKSENFAAVLCSACEKDLPSTDF